MTGGARSRNLEEEEMEDERIYLEEKQKRKVMRDRARRAARRSGQDDLPFGYMFKSQEPLTLPLNSFPKTARQSAPVEYVFKDGNSKPRQVRVRVVKKPPAEEAESPATPSSPTTSQPESHSEEEKEDSDENVNEAATVKRTRGSACIPIGGKAHKLLEEIEGTQDSDEEAAKKAFTMAVKEAYRMQKCRGNFYWANRGPVRDSWFHLLDCLTKDVEKDSQGEVLQKFTPAIAADLNKIVGKTVVTVQKVKVKIQDWQRGGAYRKSTGESKSDAPSNPQRKPCFFRNQDASPPAKRAKRATSAPKGRAPAAQPSPACPDPATNLRPLPSPCARPKGSAMATPKHLSIALAQPPPLPPNGGVEGAGDTGPAGCTIRDREREEGLGAGSADRDVPVVVELKVKEVRFCPEPPVILEAPVFPYDPDEDEEEEEEEEEED